MSASITELAREQGPVLEFMLACLSREHDSDILKLTQEKGSALNILSSDLSVAHSHALDCLSQMQIQTVEEAPPMNLNLLVFGKKPDLLQQEMEQLSADQVTGSGGVDRVRYLLHCLPLRQAWRLPS